MGWSVGKHDLPPKTQSVLTAMCKIADDRHGQFFKTTASFLREDVPSVKTQTALRKHLSILYRRGYIGRRRNGNRHKGSEYQIIALDVLPAEVIRKYHEFLQKQGRRPLPPQRTSPVIAVAPEGVSSQHLGVSSRGVGVPSGSHLEEVGVPSGSHLEEVGVPSRSHLEEDTLLENSNHENSNSPRILTTSTSKDRGSSGGSQVPSQFCLDLLESLEAHGVFGFTLLGLAFADEYLPAFLRIRREHPTQDDIDYLAEQAVRFIGSTGTDNSHRIRSFMEGVIKSALLTGTTRITLRPPNAAAVERSAPPVEEYEPLPPTPICPEAHAIWSDALEELRGQVARPAFETWLSDTVGVSYDGRTFVVGTANSFVSEMLEHRMYPLIERAVEHVAGAAVRVDFQVVVINRELEAGEIEKREVS